MNQKAKELGMTRTSFGDPSGLSPENVSSVEDLFTLARYVTSHEPRFWDITRIQEYGILGHTWFNGNTLSKRSTFLGGKNGYTDEANRTTVSLFQLPISQQNRRIVIILLKSNNKDADVDAITRSLTREMGFLAKDDKTVSTK